ncbi:MAG: hypothetical protein V2A53_01450 [bacterium]
MTKIQNKLYYKAIRISVGIEEKKDFLTKDMQKGYKILDKLYEWRENGDSREDKEDYSRAYTS